MKTLKEDYPYPILLYVDLNIKHDSNEFLKLRNEMLYGGWRIHIPDKATRFGNNGK